jgi:hypothetical protein
MILNLICLNNAELHFQGHVLSATKLDIVLLTVLLDNRALLQSVQPVG